MHDLHIVLLAVLLGDGGWDEEGEEVIEHLLEEGALNGWGIEQAEEIGEFRHNLACVERGESLFWAEEDAAEDAEEELGAGFDGREFWGGELFCPLEQGEMATAGIMFFLGEGLSDWWGESEEATIEGGDDGRFRTWCVAIIGRAEERLAFRQTLKEHLG
jgi:hypothetical protein